MTPEQLAVLFVKEQCDNTMNIHTCIEILIKNAYKAGYAYAIDKACEFIRLHIGVDIPVRLTPDGEPLAEDFINKAEARVNAANKVVEQFKQFMEE